MTTDIQPHSQDKDRHEHSDQDSAPSRTTSGGDIGSLWQHCRFWEFFHGPLRTNRFQKAFESFLGRRCSRKQPSTSSTGLYVLCPGFGNPASLGILQNFI